MEGVTDPVVRANRAVWEDASGKHVREHEELLEQARRGGSLTSVELGVLRPLLRDAPLVVHLQSGNALDDVDLVRAGARHVVGVDYSLVAASSAARRARELGVACSYLLAQLPPAPLLAGCAGVVYTGKGALIWMPDLDAWAREVVRLLAPGGHLVVHESHPMVPLWTWDPDEPRVRPDRSYFARSHTNDTYPAAGAVEWQWTLGEVVTAVSRAGLQVLELREQAEPFWRPGGVAPAAAWDGRLPNAYTLHARRPAAR